MKEMYLIHAEVFNYLEKYYEQNIEKNFFTLRKSDSNGRLSRGFWFHGNDNYLAVSFWSGTSWKNRTPNINFLIYPDGRTKLEIDTRDSIAKQLFVKEYILSGLSKLSLRQAGLNKYVKDYPGIDYMESLTKFVESGDKRLLDKAIKASVMKMGSPDNKLGFIDAGYFGYRYEEVSRRIRKEKIVSVSLEEYEISGFEIIDFLEVKNIQIQNIPKKCKWIFLTGENGCGKTSILKALALGMLERCKEHEEFIVNSEKNPEINLRVLELKTNDFFEQSTNKNTLKSFREFKPTAFASYGPIRLSTTKKVTHKLDGRDSSTYSLFNYDGQLLDIEAEVKRWKLSITDNAHEHVITNRLETIKETLIESIPGLGNIEWSRREDNKIIPTKYFEADDEGQVYSVDGVTFDKLPSGIRSLIAMIGDIIVRLFKAQINCDDVKSLQGIVIIDEIDLHLHPRYQKILVEALSTQFENIQFVVSTHSPIPLLGAPSNSTFIAIERSYEDGVKARQLEIDISDLLPNSILSSPIFNFDSYINSNYDKTKRLRTESDYDEVLFYKILENKIKDKSLRKRN
jgi:predicted ATP-binding protein involved in virulence